MKMLKLNNLNRRLLRLLRFSHSITLRVVAWGENWFGWKTDPLLTGSKESLSGLIWEPILNSKSLIELRHSLSVWKNTRTWMMKLLGSNAEERKALLSNRPKGLLPAIGKLVPKWLEPMAPCQRRLWTTIMFSTRSIVLPKDPDIETVIQDSKKLTPDYSLYVEKFWKRLRYTNRGVIPKGVRWTDWHLTSKQGPNGLALHTLIRDYSSLTEDMVKDLKVLGGENFCKAMETLSHVSPFFTGSKIPTDKGITRKISTFGDVEGKTRVVAILDYFSQSVLKPLHKYLFTVLKKIPQDYTFDQGGFVKNIRDWEFFYSCDLHAATDRFPIKVISQVLQGIFPTEYVTSWENIMSGHPFDYLGGTIKYARGNPMGAYSSWASFAVAHHFVMYIACENSGLEWHTAKYAILGDDVLIGDHKLYTEYRKILSSLDVPVSEAKTHESKDLCEFAKRWIYLGEEITPFPIPAMKEARNYAFLTSLLVQEKERGYEVDIPSSVVDWFQSKYSLQLKEGKGPRDGFFTDLKLKSYICQELIHLFRGNVTFEEAFQKLYMIVNDENPSPFMDKQWIDSFWSYFFRDLWIKSSDTHIIGQVKYHENRDESFDPHKAFLNIMMMYFDEIDELTEDGLVEVKYVPWVSLAGQLTTTSDDSNKIVTSLIQQDLTKFEGWDAVKRLVLPDLATVFRGRKYDIIRVLAGKLSTDILGLLRNGGKFTFLLDNEVGMLGKRNQAGELVRGEISCLSPLIGLTSWEGEPH